MSRFCSGARATRGEDTAEARELQPSGGGEMPFRPRQHDGVNQARLIDVF